MKGETVKRFLVSVILLCSLASGSQAQFDMNDVSILFEVDSQSHRPVPAIPLFSKTPQSHTDFISMEQFWNILHMDPQLSLEKIYEGTRESFEPEKWYVTSLRYDPADNCIEHKRDGGIVQAVRLEPTCRATLRLIVQPFDRFGATTSALHLIYRVGGVPDAVSDAWLDKLLQLKQLAGLDVGLPLQPHPAIRQRNPAYLNYLQAMLEAFRASPDKELIILTGIVEQSMFKWAFLGGLVHKGEWTRLITPVMRGAFVPVQRKNITGVEYVDCATREMCLARPRLLDKTTNEGFFALNQHINFSEDEPSPDLIQLAEAVDNPQKAHFLNTSCVSCHQSVNVRSQARLFDPFRPSVDIAPFTLGAYMSQRQDFMINFGSIGVTPQISIRVTNDTAQVVQFLNQQVLGLEPAKPHSVAALRRIWTCVHSNVTEDCWSAKTQ